VHWTNDVFQLSFAEIEELVLEFIANLFIGRLAKIDAARFSDPFQPRGDIDAVSHEIAVGLLNNIPEVNANAENNALVSGTPALRSTIAL
jgi:hypothetical protein